MAEEKRGWAAMNTKERILFLIGAVFALGTSLLMHFDPVHAYGGWAALPAAAAMVLFVCSIWRQCKGYERVCECLLAAAFTLSLLCLRFIFITPTGWAMPLVRICFVTIFMMLAVISWRKSRLEAVLFGAGGVCYLIYCIVKMLI